MENKNLEPDFCDDDFLGELAYEDLANLKSKGITQSFLAEHTGMTTNALNLSLNGNRKLVADEYIKDDYIIAITVGIVADYLISSALVNCGINITINCCIGMIVTVWFIINELISILENLSEIGTPLPKFLVAIVKRLKTTVEVKTNESEE